MVITGMLQPKQPFAVDERISHEMELLPGEQDCMPSDLISLDAEVEPSWSKAGESPLLVT
ncbi:hypothetical protein BS17DRAFT_778326 [Gyrodon lividus]|nr:hypothetical protein BS17DRAFT_778326 [Gyrodon lividus]